MTYHLEIIADGVPGGKTTTWQLYLVTTTRSPQGQPVVRHERLGAYDSPGAAEEAARMLTPLNGKRPTA